MKNGGRGSGGKQEQSKNDKNEGRIIYFGPNISIFLNGYGFFWWRGGCLLLLLLLLLLKKKIERDDIDLGEGERGACGVLRPFGDVGGVRCAGWRFPMKSSPK